MRINFIWRSAVAPIFVILASWAVCAQQGNLALPMVASANVPLYPPTARLANIQGVVKLRATTDGNRVISIEVEGGPKILADFAQENLRTWQFSAHEPTTFSITYTYKLVTDLKPTQNNPRVILDLPTAVEVDALRWPGTVDMPSGTK